VAQDPLGDPPYMPFRTPTALLFDDIPVFWVINSPLSSLLRFLVDYDAGAKPNDPPRGSSDPPAGAAESPFPLGALVSMLSAHSHSSALRFLDNFLPFLSAHPSLRLAPGPTERHEELLRRLTKCSNSLRSWLSCDANKRLVSLPPLVASRDRSDAPSHRFFRGFSRVPVSVLEAASEPFHLIFEGFERAEDLSIAADIAHYERGHAFAWCQAGCCFLCDQIIQTQRHCQIPGCECLDICTDRPGSDEHLDPEDMVRCRGCRSDVCEVLEWSSDVWGGVSAGDASCH